jgi:hypothetical protein
MKVIHPFREGNFERRKNMRTSRILIFSLALGVLAIAAGTSLLAPSEAQADTCLCGAWSTLNQWGSGTTCNAAILDFQNNAAIQAELNCYYLDREICATEAATHGACYFAGGLWRVDGQMRYKCLKCFP